MVRIVKKQLGGSKFFAVADNLSFFPSGRAHDREGGVQMENVLEVHGEKKNQPLTCAFRYRARGVAHISSTQIHYKNQKSGGVETKARGVQPPNPPSILTLASYMFYVGRIDFWFACELSYIGCV